jgi:membrane protease subunit HflK
MAFPDSLGPEDVGSPSQQIPDVRKYVGPGIAAILIIILAATSFYSVGADEVGVIRRFGRHVRTTEPGLHGKLPFGVEKATKVKVKYIFKDEFGFRTLTPGIKTVRAPRKYPEESLMLSGDLNTLVVEWIIQYKLTDPVKVLFNVRAPGLTVRAISEAVMRQVVGDHSVTEVLTTRKVEVNVEVQEKLQEILDSYDIGVQIVTVKLQDVNPPDPVKPAFNEVNQAKQEKERIINEAYEAYNKEIPRAKGEAERTITEAEGYALDRVNRAKGDAHRFLATWEEYKDAKEVTRRRLYLEALVEVLARAGKKYILDPDQGGILPLLTLGDEGGAK